MKIHPTSGRRVLASLWTACALLTLPAVTGAHENNGNGHGANASASASANANANGNGNANANANATVTSNISYSGQALALRIDGVTSVTDSLIFCNTGLLPLAGGNLEKTAANINIANGALTIGAASAQAVGMGPQSLSTSMLTDYHVEFLTDEGEHFVFDADFIQATVTASVLPNGTTETKSSVVVRNFRVNGVPIHVTGEANQKVTIAGTDCWLMFNEKSAVNGGGSGDIGVSAIHFDLCHCIEGHIGFVTAGVTATGTPPVEEEDHECGKVTGGGWIAGVLGAKGTFGMSGGIRRGEFWGHLTYHDHKTGMKIESTAVTGFEVDPANENARIITYAVKVDGVAATATVRVVDNGEPGADDVFQIDTSTGYHAGSDLGGSRPGGGNIQLHKCPPGWE